MLIQLVVIQIITFVAIVFTLRKLLYVETAKEAGRLKKLKQEAAAMQRELTQKMEAAENAYREKVAVAEEHIRSFRLKAEEQAEEMKKDTLDRANEESERILNAASNAREKMREEIALEMRKRAPALASRIFIDVLSEKTKLAAHREFVVEVANEMKKIDKAKFNLKIEKGELETAYPLDKSEKSSLSSLVVERLGYKIPFEEKVDERLVAGVIIRLGTLVIDGSLSNRLRQVEEG